MLLSPSTDRDTEAAEDPQGPVGEAVVSESQCVPAPLPSFYLLLRLGLFPRDVLLPTLLFCPDCLLLEFQKIRVGFLFHVLVAFP